MAASKAGDVRTSTAYRRLVKSSHVPDGKQLNLRLRKDDPPLSISYTKRKHSHHDYPACMFGGRARRDKRGDGVESRLESNNVGAASCYTPAIMENE